MKARVSVTTFIEVDVDDNITDEREQYWAAVNDAERRIKQAPGVIEVNEYARDSFFLVKE